MSESNNNTYVTEFKSTLHSFFRRTWPHKNIKALEIEKIRTQNIKGFEFLAKNIKGFDLSMLLILSFISQKIKTYSKEMLLFPIPNETFNVNLDFSQSCRHILIVVIFPIQN